MGTRTYAFLDTTFEEFDRVLKPFIVKKDTFRGGGTAPYAYSYFFNFMNDGPTHSLVYNNKVDKEKYNAVRNMSDEEIEEYFKELEKLPYTYIDSNNHINDGIPDGYQGILLSFGFTPKGVSILRMLVYTFGGYHQVRDTSDNFIWYDKDYRKALEEFFSW
jgi:hypothetical protein